MPRLRQRKDGVMNTLGIVEIGTYKDAKSLRRALEESGVWISGWAEDILSKIKVTKSRQTLDLVDASVEELGFSRGTELRDIYRAGGEKDWDLCPDEAAAQYLLQRGDDLKPGEVLIFAMKPIKDSDGDLYLFGVRRYDDDRWLYACDGGPDSFWSASYRFVFVRRK
ncbi:hypothetical protein KKC62_02830 [Patescibacteria group bacterium]|nr:hypothetical protein [Patescibacteria group bacterium]MBU1953117.1 hypothetical protein [Patescibacteria group bacterium]